LSPTTTRNNVKTRLRVINTTMEIVALFNKEYFRAKIDSKRKTTVLNVKKAPSMKVILLARELEVVKEWKRRLEVTLNRP